MPASRDRSEGTARVYATPINPVGLLAEPNPSHIVPVRMRRTLEQVLEEWRDLERALRSPEQRDDATVERLKSDIARLRAEYQQMTSLRRAKLDGRSGE